MMKKTFFVIGIVAAMVFTSCKKEDATSKIKSENIETASKREEASKLVPVMSFDKAEHDFGTIDQGTPQETTFTFTNTGNAPLIITNATSSCGCTVPSYPKDTPIAPGATGELLVKFSGNGANQVTKTVTVTANTQKGTETLTIKAFVTPKAPQASPVLQ